MKRLDIKIGYHCNNHCLFCAQGDKRGHYKQRSSSKIIRDLKNSRKNCDSVVFTGGEPTLHQDFLYFLKSAKDLGFKNIQVQSNGRMFVYEKFCYDSIKAGANQFALALHGHTAIIHDFLTQSPGSFEQTVQGIKNLNTLGQDVVTNTVITSKNYLYLPDIAKLLIKLGMKQIQFAFVHIIGSAWENKNFIVQKKSKLVPYLKKALDIAFTAGKIARTEAIPYCLLQGYEQCIVEQAIPKTMVIERQFKINDFKKYRVTQAKIKGPLCGKCRYFTVCEGPWREYPKIFGWSEFKPVK